jgi:hypothetical protein
MPECIVIYSLARGPKNQDRENIPALFDLENSSGPGMLTSLSLPRLKFPSINAWDVEGDSLHSSGPF